MVIIWCLGGHSRPPSCVEGRRPLLGQHWLNDFSTILPTLQKRSTTREWLFCFYPRRRIIGLNEHKRATACLGSRSSRYVGVSAPVMQIRQRPGPRRSYQSKMPCSGTPRSYQSKVLFVAIRRNRGFSELSRKENKAHPGVTVCEERRTIIDLHDTRINDGEAV